MPASDALQYLGTIFGHAHGRSAANLGALHAERRGEAWVYLATHRDGQETEHPSEIEAIEAVDDAASNYYAFSIERSFMPRDRHGVTSRAPLTLP